MVEWDFYPPHFTNNPFIITNEEHAKYFRDQIIPQVYVNAMVTFQVFPSSAFAKLYSSLVMYLQEGLNLSL